MIDNKQIRFYLITALSAVLICIISVRLALGSAGIGGVLIGLFIIFASVSYILYLMSEGNEKYKEAYSLSLIGTVAIPMITVMAYLFISNLK